MTQRFPPFLASGSAPHAWVPSNSNPLPGRYKINRERGSKQSFVFRRSLRGVKHSKVVLVDETRLGEGGWDPVRHSGGPKRFARCRFLVAVAVVQWTVAVGTRLRGGSVGGGGG